MTSKRTHLMNLKYTFMCPKNTCYQADQAIQFDCWEKTFSLKYKIHLKTKKQCIQRSCFTCSRRMFFYDLSETRTILWQKKNQEIWEWLNMKIRALPLLISFHGINFVEITSNNFIVHYRQPDQYTGTQNFRYKNASIIEIRINLLTSGKLNKKSM